MKTNLFIYLISILCLTSCKSTDYFTVKEKVFEIQDTFCSYRKPISKLTINKLHRNGVIYSKKNVFFHIKVLFKGKEGRYIALLNCNAGFQDARWLGFFDGKKLKVLVNSFDLDLLYKEYLSFCKENDPDDRGRIWEYIQMFSKQELINKYHKINF